MTFVIVINLNFNFSQVVRQHALGVVGLYGFCLQLTPLSLGEIIFKRLSFDKVIAISWWSTFWIHSVD